SWGGPRRRGRSSWPEGGMRPPVRQFGPTRPRERLLGEAAGALARGGVEEVAVAGLDEALAALLVGVGGVGDVLLLGGAALARVAVGAGFLARADLRGELLARTRAGGAEDEEEGGGGGERVLHPQAPSRRQRQAGPARPAPLPDVFHRHLRAVRRPGVAGAVDAAGIDLREDLFLRNLHEAQLLEEGRGE